MTARAVIAVVLSAGALAACNQAADSQTAVTTPPTVVTTSAVVESSAVESAEPSGPWTWTGLLIQEPDDVARACFGEIKESDPPHCPTGMPIADFDLGDIAWAERFGPGRQTLAYARIVGRPTANGFVLEGPITRASGPLDPVPCERIDRRDSADTPSPQPAFDALQSSPARDAGVWFTDGGTRGTERLDIFVLVLDDPVRTWFDARPEFDGFELEICPQMREV